MNIDGRDMTIIERLEELRDLMKLEEDRLMLQAAIDEIERLRKQVSDLHELVALATEIKPVYRRFEEKWGDIYVPKGSLK